MFYGILELASSLGPAAAPADRAAGGQTSADQAVDGPDHDVTEMVHAPIQPRVRHEEGMTEHTPITARRSQVRSILVVMMASEVYSATLAPTWPLG